jgi:DNA topoisomerase IA
VSGTIFGSTPDQVIFVPSRAEQERLTKALVIIENVEPKDEAAVNRFGLRGAAWIARTLVLVVPPRGFFHMEPAGGWPRKTELDKLPWIPKNGFEWPLSKNCGYNDEERDLLRNLVCRTDVRTMLAIEHDSGTWRSVVEFLQQDAKLRRVWIVQYALDANAEDIATALRSAKEITLPVAMTQARRRRSASDWLWKHNLRAVTLERLRDGGYVVNSNKDFQSLSLIGTAVLGAIARRDAVRGPGDQPIAWDIRCFAQRPNDPGSMLVFRLDPHLPAGAPYALVDGLMRRIGSQIRITDVQVQEQTTPPLPPFTLAELVLELDRIDPNEWTPRTIRERLGELHQWGAITRPWRTASAYPIWNANRTAFVLQSIGQTLPHLASLCAGIDPTEKAGISPRTIAVTPTGKPLGELTKGHVTLYEIIVRRWLSHQIGPSHERLVTVTAASEGRRLVARYRIVDAPGWRLVERGIPPPLKTHPAKGELWEVVDREASERAENARGPYSLSSLLEDFLDPIRLCQTNEERTALVEDGRLCSPEHLFDIIGLLLEEGLIEREKRTGRISLSARGTAIVNILPPILLFPAFAINLRTIYGKAEYDLTLLDGIDAYSREQLDTQIKTMVKAPLNPYSGWKTKEQKKKEALASSR